MFLLISLGWKVWTCEASELALRLGAESISGHLRDPICSGHLHHLILFGHLPGGAPQSRLVATAGGM